MRQQKHAIRIVNNKGRFEPKLSKSQKKIAPYILTRILKKLPINIDKIFSLRLQKIKDKA